MVIYPRSLRPGSRIKVLGEADLLKRCGFAGSDACKTLQLSA
jgi:hypothetical protein